MLFTSANSSGCLLVSPNGYGREEIAKSVISVKIQIDVVLLWITYNEATISPSVTQ
jgi:hypothetical protein